MLRTILVLALFGGGFVAALFSRYTALLFYMWFAFFRPQEWVWVDITALHLSFILALVLIFPSLGTGKFPTLRHPLAAGMAALLLSAFIAELATPMPRPNWNWLLLVSATAFVDLLLITLVNTPDRLRTIVAVVVGSVGFHAAKQGALFIILPGHKVAEGVGGAFGDNNSYAVVCAMVGLILLGLSRSARNRWERLALTGAGWLSSLAVIATYSRGGFLAIASGLIVYGLLRRVRLRWFVAAAMAGSLLWTVMPPPEGYTDRLKTIGSYQDDESAAGRLYFWGVALVMSWEQPLGVGIQNFNNVYNQYDPSQGAAFGKSRSVHSSHLQVLTETGMFGFAVWVFMLLYSLVLGMRVRRRGASPGYKNGELYISLADGLTAAMVAFIVGGTFTAIAYSDFVWCILAIMAALDRVSLAEALSAADTQTEFARTTPFSPGLSEWTNSYAGS